MTRSTDSHFILKREIANWPTVTWCTHQSNENEICYKNCLVSQKCKDGTKAGPVPKNSPSLIYWEPHRCGSCHESNFPTSMFWRWVKSEEEECFSHIEQGNIPSCQGKFGGCGNCLLTSGKNCRWSTLMRVWQGKLLGCDITSCVVEVTLFVTACTLVWRVKPPDWEKLFKHTAHENGFSPGWARRVCRLKSPDCENLFRQTVHE